MNSCPSYSIKKKNKHKETTASRRIKYILKI